MDFPGKSKPMRLCALLAVCCALAVAHARAEATGVPGINVDSHSGVEMKVTTSFEQLTPAGFATLQIYIRNSSGQPRTWTFDFNSSSTGEDRFHASRHLTVQNNAEQTFEVLVPLPASSNTSYAYIMSNLQIAVSGYGIVGGMAGLSSGGTSGRTLTDFVLMSQLLNERSGGPLKKACTDKGSELVGGEFDPHYLPTDWRGYLGVGTLWITDSEYQGLDPVPRNAVREWVSQGGTLVICSTSQHQVTDFGFRDDRPGYGHVRLIQWDGRELDPAMVMPFIVSREHSIAATLAGGYNSNWNLALPIGHAEFSGWFIMLFVIGFGLVIGPLNLFRFAKAGKRHRLFWTTPLISIAGSLLLAVVIYLQDGLGGNGRRMVLVQLMPGDNEAVIAQEQISRTGLLVSSGFNTEERIFISPISNLALSTSPYSSGVKFKSRVYTINGAACSGDWFASRSVQAQLIEAVRPSRSRIEIIPAAGGAAPALLSSIENDLKQVFYIDADGKYWMANETRVGEKKPLRPSTEAEFDQWLDSNTSEAGGRINYLLSQGTRRRGYFYAVADDSGSDSVATLTSIHWGKSKTFYLGPCAGETGGAKP